MKIKLLSSILIIFAFVCLTSFQTLSQEPALAKFHKDIPKLLGSNNEGNDFWMTFLPGPETQGGGRNDIKIYVSSNMETLVTVEVPGKGFITSKKTIPNDIIEFTLSPSIAQCYRKAETQKPNSGILFDAMGVHVYANDPIIVYGVTLFAFASDGFLAIPVSSLGKEYICSSWADGGDNAATSGKFLTSYIGITSPYFQNKVRFTLGGNSFTKTTDGQLPGETKTYNLYNGDVLLIGSLGQYADLSGSKILSTKPVSVVSGNFCANIPENVNYCNFIEEMELPTNTWGKIYHVTPVFDRKKASMIKIFAKEADTRIMLDGGEIAHLVDSNGFENQAWIKMRADTGSPRPIVFLADKPISVTQFNTGQFDDGVQQAPFQMALTPFEQFQHEITFNTPGTMGNTVFTNNYLNIVFRGNDDGSIPDDLEFATVQSGQFVWQRINVISPQPGQQFRMNIQGHPYFSKTILLPGNGLYKVRATSPLCAYVYGFNDYQSYGFPAGVGLPDLEKTDTLPPNPTYMLYCDGFVGSTDGLRKDAVVEDMPKNDDRSNLAFINYHSDESYNFKFTYLDFVPGTPLTKWRAWVVDPSKDAKCVITFIDRRGNDTTITILFYSFKLSVRPDLDFGSMYIGETKEMDTWIINESDRADYLLSLLKLLKNTDFTIDSLALPLWLKKGDSIKVKVKFTATQIGNFSDSIMVVDTCNFFYKSELKANVITTSVNDSISITEPSIHLLPNPVINTLTITWNTEFIPERIVVCDILGNITDDLQINQYTNDNNFSLNTGRYSDGIYILKIISNNQVLFKRFCVIR